MIKAFYELLILSSIIVVLTSCNDTRTPQATIGTAGAAIRNNDLATFRDTLIDPALQDWGTPAKFAELQRLAPQQRLKILELKFVKRESCGHNSCMLRYYHALIGLETEGQPRQILGEVEVVCQKVAKHRECWIYQITTPPTYAAAINSEP